MTEARTSSTRRKARPAQSRSVLKLVFSPGATPDKWISRFDERTDGWVIGSAPAPDPLAYIDRGVADIGLMRLPAAEDAPSGVEELKTRGFHVVRLYEEKLGVAAPKEHVIGAVDHEVAMADLDGEMRMYVTPASGVVDLKELRDALSVVAANVGIVLAPCPLLRALNVRGVIHREVIDDPADEGSAEIGRTVMALVWKQERDDDVIQDFVGICRGRRPGTSRSRSRKRR